MVFHRFCPQLLCLALFLSLQSVSFGRVLCPETLAVIPNDLLATTTLEAFKKLYLQLGCSPKLFELPGRRGILHFNKGLVDGELYRLSQVEKKYSRPFVRSATPLFQISNALWLHPDQKVRRRFPIGYVLGVIWEEQYIKDRNGVSFPSTTIMFASYQKGLISGFLASDNLVSAQIAKDRLLPSPILGELISSTPVYHYLGLEYAEFMGKVSEVLIKDNPFEKVSMPANKQRVSVTW